MFSAHWGANVVQGGVLKRAFHGNFQGSPFLGVKAFFIIYIIVMNQSGVQFLLWTQMVLPLTPIHCVLLVLE